MDCVLARSSEVPVAIATLNDHARGRRVQNQVSQRKGAFQRRGDYRAATIRQLSDTGGFPLGRITMPCRNFGQTQGRLIEPLTRTPGQAARWLVVSPQ
jgi:hypothetical protein